MVEVNVSETGVGAILSQFLSQRPKLFRIAFFSKKLCTAKEDYKVGSRELLAIKLPLKEWRHLLEFMKQQIIVEQTTRMLYLCTAKYLNPRQAYWPFFFTSFDFIVPYVSGSMNAKADIPSCMHTEKEHALPHENILPRQCIVNYINWDFYTELVHAVSPEGCPPNLTCVPPKLWSKIMGTCCPSISSYRHPKNI